MKCFKLALTLLVICLLTLTSFAQCNTANFTVTKINGTCFSNASITVTVPTSSDCSQWVAEIVKTTAGSTPIVLTVPTTGGNVLFSSLTAGSYNISLSNGFTTVQYASNPVVLTSSYVNMSVSSTSNPPVCTNSSPGYAPNGTLTANVTGGTGPFFYQLITSFSTQTGTSASRSFTFNNVPGGEQVNLQVTDQVNGTAGCENTITQTPTTVAQTAADLRYGFRAYNFVRECSSCTTAKLFINLDNLSTARRDILLQPGNAKITISGVDYPLTYVSAQNRFTYDPVATGGPSLTHGLPITTTFNWGCKILTRTNTVELNNNFLNVFSTNLMNPDCSFKYKITVIGDSDHTNTGYTDRNIYFCESNTVVIERRISTSPDVWQVVSGSDISPDPATLTTDLNVVGALTASIPSAAGAFFVYQTGVYRVTATDACHSVSRTITITDTIPINSLNAYSRTSVLSGTVGFEVQTNSFTGQYPLTVKVERVDGQTSMPITAAGPLSLTGNYTVNFPITRIFTNNPTWFNILDLPPGNYKIEYSDGCTAATGNKKIQTINLTNVAGYNPQFSIVEGCSNSNSISFNLNPNANSFLPTYTHLKTSSGTILQTIAGTSGVFNNLASGNYILNFTTSGASGTAFSAAFNRLAPFEYTKPITVAPFQNYGITTSTILCDLNDPNSGIVSAQAVNGTIISPLTFSLYSTSNATTPVQGPFTVTNPNTSYLFTNVPIGNYFVRVTSACFSLDKNITVSSVSTVPTAQVSNPTICPGSATSVAFIAASQNLFDVTWYANGQVVGTGMPITLAPLVTTTYTATFALKSTFGCPNTITYQSDVTITVTPNPNLGLSVSDINLCDGTSPRITISNTQNEFSYEIVDANGFSFSPPLIANGNGGSLTIAIPNTFTLVAGQVFKVKATNGNAGCTGLLTDVCNVLSGTFNITCPTFPSSTVQCYSDLPSQTSYTIAQFQSLGNGNGIVDIVGCGAVEITAANGANPGCEGNVIRTYTISEYADPNNNDIRDSGENTVLKTTTCSQTYTIERLDFTMPANQGSTVACAALIVAPTVPAVTDNCGTTLTASAPVISTSPTCEGDVTYTYTYTDCEGNTHDWVYTYTIDDNIAPTGTAPGNLTFQCIAEVPVANITSVTDEADNCSGSVVVTVADANNGGTGCSGNPYVITRTYTLTDCAGNVTNLVQTITVQDTTAPIITSAVGSLDVTLECSDAAAISAALASVPVATDNCTSSLQIHLITDTTTISTLCANTYIRTRVWNFTDGCSNLSNNFTQIITIQDDTKPNFIGQLPQDLTLQCNQIVPTAAVLTTTDNCNGIVTVDFEEQTIAGSCPSNSTILRTWTATDICGNFETHTQEITIEDNTPPTFDQDIRTPELYTKCDAIPAPQEFNALDLCGTATISYNEVNIEGDCTNKYRIERTWRATDSCGNFREITQTVYLACDVEVFNAVSPDGDGLNDSFRIEGLECYPNNTVEIYNRLGVKVYETSSYDNFDNSFKGFSDGRTTMSRSEKLPTGTYWYILKYEYDLYGTEKENKQKIGYLYIQND